MITITIGEGEQQTQVIREKTDEEFIEAENNKERADIQATNILSQGLPRHIFNTLNQTEMTKEIWENVELLHGKVAGLDSTNKRKKTLKIPVESENTKLSITYLSIWGRTKATQSTSSPSQYVPPPPQYAPAPQQAPQSTNDAMARNDEPDSTIQAGQITTESVQRRAPGNKGKHVATDLKERCKRNADLEEQLVSLKQQLLQHVESNKSLKTKSEKLKADKNALEESYLEELVWLINTNKVVIELLQSYGQPVQTIPMLSKRPTFSIKDLHKSALGHRNPLYLKSAQLCRPTLYLGDVIVDPVHTSLRVYDSEETLVQAEVRRIKMLEKMKDL
ncbi:hypothetical protein Tco_0291296 [Tanacetum coccineum]